MYQIKICRSVDQAKQVSLLADEIWHECFSSMLNQQQIDYMLHKFQSEKAIVEQVFDYGYRYYILYRLDIPVGYCGICPECETGRLLLSKLYLKQECRGQGLARQLLNQVILYAKELDLNQIYLTVNKHNQSAIDVYKAFGFVVEDSVEKDIGEGFIMDDYILSLQI